jgi:hypothetical protein
MVNLIPRDEETQRGWQVAFKGVSRRPYCRQNHVAALI